MTYLQQIEDSRELTMPSNMSPNRSDVSPALHLDSKYTSLRNSYIQGFGNQPFELNPMRVEMMDDLPRSESDLGDR